MEWYPCSPTDGLAGTQAATAFTCAVVQVPLDYDDPGGIVIDIALKRRTHTGGSPLGALFVNPGGPGGSGVALVESLDHYVSTEVQQSYDVIGFDPRGVGASMAITCPASDGDASGADLAENATWSLDDGRELPPSIDPLVGADIGAEVADDRADGHVGAAADPDADQQRAEVSRRYTDLRRRCEAGTDPVALLDHVDTESAARDLDVLRAAAGYQVLNYLGYSYGTFLGTTYADLFPSRVGRFVLDGAMDPSLSLPATRLDQAHAFERALGSYVEYCLSADGCPLTGGSQAGVQQVRDLISSASQSPLASSDPQRQVHGTELVLVIKRMLYAPEYWAVLTTALAQAVSEADGSTFALLHDQLTSGNQGLAGAYNAVTCQDYPASGSAQEWTEQYHELQAASPTFGESLAWSEAGCAAWGHSGTRVPRTGARPGCCTSPCGGHDGRPHYSLRVVRLPG
ncbi:alpha/beta hydrolase [Actinomyces wuliandei]|uniref:alpha/beta hydrolase n=1 Tax=Actinomyces wuliandei TaxID=2057743 RepID=UPI00214B0F44|nr:alpha/beta hydrolase [Actinomyces wuliandei]